MSDLKPSSTVYSAGLSLHVQCNDSVVWDAVQRRKINIENHESCDFVLLVELWFVGQIEASY